jgi:hypothetical protein
VRVLLLHHPDGSVSVLITNLLNRRLYPRESIIDLYFRRWKVEIYQSYYLYKLVVIKLFTIVLFIKRTILSDPTNY